MNEKAVLEIADLIRVKRKLNLKLLSAQEVINTYEYKQFRKRYPELCKLVEE